MPARIDVPPEILALMRRLYEADRLSEHKVAARLGLDYNLVRRRLREMGVPCRPIGPAQRTLPLNEAAFDRPTPDALYWAGFLMADGWLQSFGCYRRVGLTLAAADRAHVEKFRAFLGAGHKLHETPAGWKTFTTNGRRYWCDGLVKLVVPSRRLVEALARYGVVPRKSLVARATRLGADSPDFWRGVIDGDGSVGIGRDGLPVLALVGARPLLRQFAAFVHRRGLWYRPPSVHRRGRIFNLSMVGTGAYQAIGLLYGGGGTSLDRKRAVADRVTAGPPPGPPVRRPRLYREFEGLPLDQLRDTLAACGGVVAEVARRLGAPERRLGEYVSWHGLRDRPARYGDALADDAIVAAVREAGGVWAAAPTLGVCAQTLYRQVEKRGLRELLGLRRKPVG